MQSSTNYCKLPGPYGYKWPKLSELHIKLFWVDFENDSLSFDTADSILSKYDFLNYNDTLYQDDKTQYAHPNFIFNIHW